MSPELCAISCISVCSDWLVPVFKYCFPMLPWSWQGVNIGSDQYLAFWDAAVHTKELRGNLEDLLARWKKVSVTGLPEDVPGYKQAVHALCILQLPDLAKVLPLRSRGSVYMC